MAISFEFSQSIARLAAVRWCGRMQACSLNVAILLLALPFTGCTTGLRPNLTPTPYTSVVDIELRADGEPTPETGRPVLYRTDASRLMIRDKEVGRIFYYSAGEDVQAQLGLGTYQVLALTDLFDDSKPEYREIVQRRPGSQVTMGYAQDGFNHAEVRAEFTITQADLGKEINLGSISFNTGAVSGARFHMMDHGANTLVALPHASAGFLPSSPLTPSAFFQVDNDKSQSGSFSWSGQADLAEGATYELAIWEAVQVTPSSVATFVRGERIYSGEDIRCCRHELKSRLLPGHAYFWSVRRTGDSHWLEFPRQPRAWHLIHIQNTNNPGN